MRLFWILLFGMLALPAPAQAQDLGAFDQLLRVKSVRCQFGEGTTASWDGGKLKLERGAAGEGMNSTFDSIDIKKRHARLITRAGAGDVQVIADGNGLTFYEFLPLGGLNITTVFHAQIKTPHQRFIAVMSKHVVLLSGPLPSQWHGTCEVLH